MCMPIQKRTMVTRHVSQIAESDLPRDQIQGLRAAAERRTSDYVLARAAARGAMAALGDLYERHNRRVYAVCLGMTRDSAEAEDLSRKFSSIWCARLGHSGARAASPPGYIV